jgi:hypothetical protein
MDMTGGVAGSVISLAGALLRQLETFRYAKDEKENLRYFQKNSTLLFYIIFELLFPRNRIFIFTFLFKLKDQIRKMHTNYLNI